MAAAEGYQIQGDILVKNYKPLPTPETPGEKRIQELMSDSLGSDLTLSLIHI